MFLFLWGTNLGGLLKHGRTRIYEIVGQAEVFPAIYPNGAKMAHGTGEKARWGAATPDTVERILAAKAVGGQTLAGVTRFQEGGGGVAAEWTITPGGGGATCPPPSQNSPRVEVHPVRIVGCVALLLHEESSPPLPPTALRLPVGLRALNRRPVISVGSEETLSLVPLLFCVRW